jgi:UDP-glucose 4-epimerase
VTGGGGYIGSHCILQLLEHKFKVVAVDNFENATKGKNTGNTKGGSIIVPLTSCLTCLD